MADCHDIIMSTASSNLLNRCFQLEQIVVGVTNMYSHQRTPQCSRCTVLFQSIGHAHQNEAKLFASLQVGQPWVCVNRHQYIFALLHLPRALRASIALHLLVETSVLRLMLLFTA